VDQPSPDFDADGAQTDLERWLRTSLDGLAGAQELAQPQAAIKFGESARD
jgi:hypothetical protein